MVQLIRQRSERQIVTPNFPRRYLVRKFFVFGASGIFLLFALLWGCTPTVSADGGCTPNLTNPGGIPDSYWNYTAQYSGLFGLSGQHLGQDFKNPDGSYTPFPVVAVLSGTITRLESNNYGSGGVVDITMDGCPGVVVEYVHLQGTSIAVSDNQHIDQGTFLAIADGSGAYSGGPHLHMFLIIDGVKVDPMEYMTDGQSVTPRVEEIKPSSKSTEETAPRGNSQPVESQDTVSWWPAVLLAATTIAGIVLSPVIVILLVVIVFTVLKIIGWLFPKIGLRLVYVLGMNQAQIVNGIRWAMKEMMIMSVFWAVVIVSVVPTIRDSVHSGFTSWWETGSTLIPNWGIVALFGGTIVSFWARMYVNSREKALSSVHPNKRWSRTRWIAVIGIVGGVTLLGFFSLPRDYKVEAAKPTAISKDLSPEIYSGVYGHPNNGWGSLGQAKTAEEIVNLVVNNAQGATPVIFLNILGASKSGETRLSDEFIRETIRLAEKRGVIVSLDIQPNGTSLSDACFWAAGFIEGNSNVWVSVDTERISPVSAAEINQCAHLINFASEKSGVNSKLGVWEFGGGLVADPQNIKQQWSHLVVYPLNDSIGTLGSKVANVESQRGRWGNPDFFGAMEWITLFGSQYDSGFTPSQLFNQTDATIRIRY